MYSSQQSPAAPAGAAPAAAGATPDEFRAALGQLAAGVSLLTAHDPEDGEDAGMTATSFLSVSLDPPLVLVSLRTDSRMDELLSRAGTWAVSLLGEEHRTLASRFAMKGRLGDRLLFADAAWHRGAHAGAPLIDGALATVECRTEQRIPAGDHTLVLGRVLAAEVPAPGGRPLLYLRGGYRTLG
ncbi:MULTISPECIES: flavin reductase family protein [Kitasatospora]|uniref:Putative NADPH-flavin oxidoreductase n=1 Tax=Kitasatospora setae (strain ATCC 33774 / DSM 43861 / JCM 3304 / KCC A-0304 / NBRC 14216 / KM-6054) TaxID=452652 RepID=E4NF98_KITSK|nr:flavin reductase family protein [Kitasatospora setae]BAJ30178.1 putative NADPH-flavin oxidoreductase [Kitasatospora setae KM-6054]